MDGMERYPDPWSPGGKFVSSDEDTFSHPPRGIKCRNCVMRLPDFRDPSSGEVLVSGYDKVTCRAWDGGPNRKPTSVLWHNGPCEAYWPEDGVWIGDDPM